MFKIFEKKYLDKIKEQELTINRHENFIEDLKKVFKEQHTKNVKFFENTYSKIKQAEDNINLVEVLTTKFKSKILYEYNLEYVVEEKFYPFSSSIKECLMLLYNNTNTNSEILLDYIKKSKPNSDEQMLLDKCDCCLNCGARYNRNFNSLVFFLLTYKNGKFLDDFVKKYSHAEEFKKLPKEINMVKEEIEKTHSKTIKGLSSKKLEELENRYLELLRKRSDNYEINKYILKDK